MKALVTGFEPFGGDDTNPAREALRLLPPRLGDMVVTTRVLPTAFGRSLDTLADALAATAPDVVLGVGLAGGRGALSLERVAINIDDARIADNGGARPIDEPVARGGPPAYFATVPVKAMVQAMRAAGVPAEVSNSAGTYVCNHLMYGVLHYIANRHSRHNSHSREGGNPGLDPRRLGDDIRAGFIHVPYSEEQVLDKHATAGMAIATMVGGLVAAIGAAARSREDIKVSGGALA